MYFKPSTMSYEGPEAENSTIRTSKVPKHRTDFSLKIPHFIYISAMALELI